MKSRTLKIVIVNVVLSVVGIALVLIGTEWYLRKHHSFYDLFDAGYEKPWFRGNQGDLTKIFAVDPDIGFCPITPGPQYNELGARINTYPADKSEGTYRILFVGDSVTRLGFIVDELKKRYGNESIEYWNAGVDSFNTVQELSYYKKFNKAMKPDHIVLTFHNNDYETTPIVFLNDEGRMVLFSPFLPRNMINEKLFRTSYLYRKVIGKRIAEAGNDARDQIAAEVRASLSEFQAMLADEGVAFTVLVHPVLLPKGEWSPDEQLNHDTTVQIAQDLGIDYYDLAEPLWTAIDAGVNPQWAHWKNDKAHPSREMAGLFADYLVEQRMLDREPVAVTD